MVNSFRLLDNTSKSNKLWSLLYGSISISLLYLFSVKTFSVVQRVGVMCIQEEQSLRKRTPVAETQAYNSLLMNFPQ